MPYDSTTGIYTYDGTEAASPYKTMLNLLGNSVKTAIANLAASFSDTQQGAAQWAYNSCFDVWQRGTGDFTATGWTADRWNMISRTATTVRRTTLAASDTFFQTAYAMQIQATNATNSAKIVQPFPSEDVAEMRGKTVVFEVYAQALTSATTQLTVAIEKSTTANVATSGTWVVVNSTTATVTQAGTKVLVTTTIPADSTAAGVRISVSTNNVPNSGGVNIGRITFKPGTTGPTTHQRRGRTIGGEEMECRDFFKMLDSTLDAIYLVGSWYETGALWTPIYFERPMRSAPSVLANLTSGSNTINAYGGGGNTTVNTITTYGGVLKYGGLFKFGTAVANNATGRSGFIGIAVGCWIAFNSELP